MPMNLRQVIKHTTAQFEAGNAVIWVSDPGIGKTDSVKTLVKWMRKRFPGERLGISTVFMATCSPMSFMGLPWKGELEYNGKKYTITDPAIPQWFIAMDLATGEIAPADQFTRVLLVIEEWGQGDGDTKRLGADVLLHGACGKWRLPPGSFRLALSNSSPRDGVSKEYDFVINRRAEKHVIGDEIVWREDFADRPQEDGMLIMPVTKVWTKQNPGILFEAKPKVQGPWCTPRSLTMWDRYAQVISKDTGGDLPLDEPDFIESTAGLIGMPATQSLLATCRFKLELPSLEDVIKDPMGTPVPDKPDRVMLQMYEMAAHVNPDDLGPVLQYVGRIKASDMHITFVTALLRRDYKGIIDHPAMKAWVTKNARLVATVGALAHAA